MALNTDGLLWMLVMGMYDTRVGYEGAVVAVAADAVDEATLAMPSIESLDVMA